MLHQIAQAGVGAEQLGYCCDLPAHAIAQPQGGADVWHEHRQRHAGKDLPPRLAKAAAHFDQLKIELIKSLAQNNGAERHQDHDLDKQDRKLADLEPHDGKNRPAYRRKGIQQGHQALLNGVVGCRQEMSRGRNRCAYQECHYDGQGEPYGAVKHMTIEFPFTQEHQQAAPRWRRDPAERTRACHGRSATRRRPPGRWPHLLRGGHRDCSVILYGTS